MRPTHVFLLSVAAGAAATVLYARIFSSQPAGEAPKAASAPPRGAAPAKKTAMVPKAGAERPATGAAGVARPAAPPAVAPAAPAPAPANPPAPAAAAPEPTALEIAQANAARLAAQEPLTHELIRGMLEKTLAGKLIDRELTASEYDRLADALLRIRASQRVLEGIPESDPGAEVRALHVDVLQAAFAEIQDVTGIAPSDMGDVLAGAEPVENPPHGLGRVP